MALLCCIQEFFDVDVIFVIAGDDERVGPEAVFWWCEVFKAPQGRRHALTNIVKKHPLIKIKQVIPFAAQLLQQFFPQKNAEFAICGQLVESPVIELRMDVVCFQFGEKLIVAILVQVFELARNKVQGFPVEITRVVC